MKRERDDDHHSPADRDIELSNFQKLIQAEESIATDHGDDPHIYNNFFQYMLALIGLTVGFGSFWRFPYLIYKNGGGVFLIPYLIAMAVVGVPLLYLQTAVGQMHRCSLPFVLKKIHPALKALGVAMLASSFHMASVYNIILTYSYRFVFSAFNPDLPLANEAITQKGFFQNVILEQSDSIYQFQGINWVLFVLYVCSLLICHRVIKNGVKESGKIVIVTALLPFVFLIILLARGLFLEGAGTGLSYLFKPKWDRLWTFQIWIDATVQVFYQLSLAIGSIISLSSMKPRREPFAKSIFVIPFFILLCGMLSALNIFVYLGHFCLEEGYEIGDEAISLSGIQLSFNVFPKALALLPFKNLWILLFFIAMVFLGIDSEFGMLQAVYRYLKDEFHDNQSQIFGIRISFQRSKQLYLCLVMIGAPTLTSHAGIYYLQFYDKFISNVPFTLNALIELYLFVHLFKFSELDNQISRYTGERTLAGIRWMLQSKLMILILSGIFCFAFIEQFVAFRLYSLKFYLFGWAISLYPYIFALIYWRKNKDDQPLKLTWRQIEDRSSYL